MTGIVIELDRFRERRDVRRVAAVALVSVAVATAIIRARDAWLTVEDAIRRAADLLPDPGDDGNA